MEQLYYENSYLKSFMCTVISCEPGKGGYEIVLNQTAFYPEGGGQPADTGVLGNVRVLDVHEKNGRIIHYTDGPLKIGSVAEGRIDWQRRFDHMQQHTGEHILSGLIHNHFGYNNVGFHLGEDEVTIDFDGVLTLKEAQKMETEANKKIYEDLPVRIFYPDRDELEKLTYRSKKELTGNVRIVEVPGADICACCGTHVERTGEIGCIKVTSLIHYKGGIRMTIVCGYRALEDYRHKQQEAVKISNLLSAKISEIGTAVEKLKEESGARASKISGLYRELFEAWAREFPESDDRLLVWKKDLAPNQLRDFCTILCQEKKGRIVLVCSEKDGTFQYALGSTEVDVRTLSRDLNGRLEGRGGGGPNLAQGTFRASKDAVKAAFWRDNA